MREPLWLIRQAVAAAKALYAAGLKGPSALGIGQSTCFWLYCCALFVHCVGLWVVLFGLQAAIENQSSCSFSGPFLHGSQLGFRPWVDLNL
jgi:hypothetical protein